jgi:hypothetical protein
MLYQVNIPKTFLTADKKFKKQTMRRIGLEIKKAEQKNLASGNASGILYKSIRVRGKTFKNHKASAPLQTPAKLSGQLADNIAVKSFGDGDGVAVTAKEFYAGFLEQGATGVGQPYKPRLAKGHLRARPIAGGKGVLMRRPFARPALETVNATDIGQRITDALTQGLSFKEV